MLHLLASDKRNASPSEPAVVDTNETVASANVGERRRGIEKIEALYRVFPPGSKALWALYASSFLWARRHHLDVIRCHRLPNRYVCRRDRWNFARYLRDIRVVFRCESDSAKADHQSVSLASSISSASSILATERVPILTIIGVVS